ncbi:MAG: hypothetical protein AB7T49_16810 [Oligoflexales bacterium]
MKPYFLLALFHASMFVGCKSMSTSGVRDTQQSEPLVKDEWIQSASLQDDLPQIECTAGIPMYLTLEAATTVPSEDRLPFQGWNKVDTIENKQDFNLRMDACYDELTNLASLHRIVQKTRDGIFIIMSIKGDASINGLAEALMGDYTQLKIINPYTEWFFIHNAKNRIVIQGGIEHEGQNLVAFVHETQKPDGSFGKFEDTMWSNAIMVGIPALKDPFSDYVCPTSIGASSITVDDTKMEFEFCHGGGTSGTWNVKYTKITITDNSPLAPENIRNKPVVVKEINARHRHHNICDSIFMKTDDAEYILTSGPAGVANESDAIECVNKEKVFLVNPKPSDGPWRMVYKKIYPKTNQSKQGKSDLMHWGKDGGWKEN